MKKHILIAGFLALALLGASVAQAAEKTLNFTVTRKGADIGTHVIGINTKDDRTDVSIKTRIAVKVLFITAYTYSFDGTESWKGGKLVALKARSNDNGEKHDVSVEKNGDKLTLTVDGKARDIDGGIIASSWWNKTTVKRSQLIDLVTGQLQEIAVKPAGAEDISVSGKTIPAEAYNVSGGIERKLWYAKDGTFARMSFTKKGDLIEYVRR